MPFGVVSRIDDGMGALKGVQGSQGEGGGLEDFVPTLLWGVNRHYQAKRARYSNVHIMETTSIFMDSKQVLHTSKDPQIGLCCVGGPKTCNTNPRWRTGYSQIFCVSLTSSSGMPT